MVRSGSGADDVSQQVSDPVRSTPQGRDLDRETTGSGTSHDQDRWESNVGQRRPARSGDPAERGLGAGDRRLQPVGGGRPGGLDDLVAVMTPVLWHVVRAYRLPESRRGRRPVDLAGAGHPPGAIVDPLAVGGWLTTTARREAWRVAKCDQRGAPVEDEVLAPRLPRQRSAEDSAVARRARPAVGGGRRAPRALPAAAADRGLREPTRLPPARDRPRHARRQHRTDPGPVPGQAARGPRCRQERHRRAS